MRERYQRIKALAAQHTVRALCQTLAVSPSGYYAWQRSPASQRSRTDQRLTELLVKEHLQSRKTYGRPRLLVKLRRLGHCHGHTRIARLMRAAHISGRPRRSFRPLTTQSHHQGPIAPNLLASHNDPTATNQIWLTDLTYVQTAEGWLYVSCIIDRYSRRVVGWAFGDTLDATLPLKALNMALLQRRPAKGLVHHSDRGCQYASSCYRQALESYGVSPSMSRAGNCYDNAAMESFWSTLKREMIYRQTFLTRTQASAAIFEYIETFYNPVRLHSALNYQSPVDFEQQNN
jgi:putative transposase